jgi:hypothetical protein
MRRIDRRPTGGLCPASRRGRPPTLTFPGHVGPERHSRAFSREFSREHCCQATFRPLFQHTGKVHTQIQQSRTMRRGVSGRSRIADVDGQTAVMEISNSERRDVATHQIARPRRGLQSTMTPVVTPRPW